MEERMNPSDELAERSFDPEMTEPDEANAPDDTGPTASTPGGGSGPEEIGV